MKSLSKKEKNEVAEKHPVFDWIDAMVSAAVFCMVIFTFFMAVLLFVVYIAVLVTMFSL